MKKPAQQVSRFAKIGHEKNAPPARPSSQQRDDRASGDDDPAPRLPRYVRFSDLRTAGIVTNWTQLQRLVEYEQFPAGVMLSPNVRAWPLNLIERWLAGRPAATKHQEDVAMQP